MGSAAGARPGRDLRSSCDKALGAHKHPSTLTIYAEKLRQEGSFSAEEIESIQTEYRHSLDQALERARKDKIHSKTDTLQGAWEGMERRERDQLAVTEVDRELLDGLCDRMTSFPEGFTPHRRVAKLMQTRAEMVQGKSGIDWGCGELLAYGTLVLEGYHVRLSGQDVTRGTFSHRHANLVDVETGADWTALAHLPGAKGQFHIHDSPLSEAGVLGFEFGAGSRGSLR